MVLCCGILLAGGILSLPSADLAQSPVVPTLVVDAAANRHAISPDIYGIASYGLDPAFAKEIQVPNVRWGGDTTSRYNWLVDSSNMGFDWYFLGGCSNAALLGFQSCSHADSIPGYTVDQMIATDGAAGARALITIPIIPFVNRSATPTCSFPVSTYGPQQKTDPDDHPSGQQCGNSISILDEQIRDTDVYANHVDNSVSLQQGWVQHLISTFGTAANGGVPYYQLDNEPSGWWNTDRDVMPAGADYPTIVTLGQRYAAMIKETDPSASVFGPSDYSGNGWIGDTGKQNNLYAGQYYLEQMAVYEQQQGQRILDYFDEHYYATSADDASELASSRTLWDPTYTSSGSSVFNGPMQLIPRFRNWVQQYYPGTKLSLSEYGFSSGRDPLVDGLTEADVLGVFGREGLDFANIWTVPMPPAPVLCVFRLFRNYDGEGGQFGDTSVESNSSNEGALSVYGAQRAGDSALTVLIINKTTQPIATTLSLADFSAVTAAAFSYSSVDLAHIVPVGNVAVSSNQIDYTYPAYSATLFVIPDAAPVLATMTELSASALILPAGQNTTFTARVSFAGNSSVPTGTVAFASNQTVLGTVSLAGGQASFTTSDLSSGTHSIRAAYSGDVNDAASVSALLTVHISGLPDYSLALSNSALQVAPGNASTLLVTVTPQNGFAQPVALSCGGLPTGVTCAFNPAMVTPQGVSPATTTMTVTAPARASATKFRLNLPGRPKLLALLSSLLLILSLAAAIAFRGAVRPLPTMVRSLGVLFVACSVCLAGCAFESPGRNTPTEIANSTAYIVTVAAGGRNAPVHSQELTLTLLE